MSKFKGINSFLRKKGVKYKDAVTEYYSWIKQPIPEFKIQIDEITMDWKRFANCVDKALFHGRLVATQLHNPKRKH